MEAKLLLLAAFVCSMLLMSYNYGRKKIKVIFFGDFIIEQEMKADRYITKLMHLLKRDDEDGNYDLLSAGADGNKVNDLYLRIDEDVLAKGPDIVILMGENNLLNKQASGRGTDIREFEDRYEAIIKKLQASGIKIIICTPAIGEKIINNELENDLNKYSQMIRNIAQKNDLPLVDLRQSFLTYNLTNSEDKQAGTLTADGVHLNEAGNQLVAEEIYKVIKQLK